MNARRLISTLLTALTLALAPGARAQWLTQTISLKDGWNAVFLHVDCAHTNIAAFADIAGPIEEIWLWQPAPTTSQFVATPQAPVTGGSQWVNWKRTDVENELNSLPGNRAYLVRVTGDYTWSLKGRPRAPRYDWTASGLNLIGFPTSPSNPPTFNNFFAQDPEFRQALQLFYYDGGELGETNPRELFNFMLASKTVRRGAAYWMRAGTLYNKTFGTFDIAIQSGTSLDFSDSLGQISFRLRNRFNGTNTVTLRLLASEAPPALQPSIAGVPPLLVRGLQNLTNLAYAYTALTNNGTHSWTLKPAGQAGSEVEVVLGLNRYEMAAAGALFAGTLRLTDSPGYTQVDVGVSASAASKAGLWVGNASVANVNAYLKSFQTDGSGARMVNANGAYVVSGLNTNAGAAARPFPLRMILHADANGHATLLERVFLGMDAGTNFILAKREASLDHAQISSARRISAAHLPWRESNAGWASQGLFQQGGSLTNVVTMSHGDQSSNPFLHTYHPDHDNLDASFQTALAQGVESYGITRRMIFSIQPPANDFASLTASGQSVTGIYQEDMTIAARGTEARTFTVRGTFKLNRIANLDTLTP
jgi:hypothetical protein